MVDVHGAVLRVCDAMMSVMRPPGRPLASVSQREDHHHGRGGRSGAGGRGGVDPSSRLHQHRAQEQGADADQRQGERWLRRQATLPRSAGTLLLSAGEGGLRPERRV